MPYQFRQTGAEIQDILDQVGENAQDISTLNSNLTNISNKVGSYALINGVKCFSRGGNYTKFAMKFNAAGAAYGPLLICCGANLYYAFLLARGDTATRITGSGTLTYTYDPSTYTYTFTHSSATQIMVIGGGGIGGNPCTITIG